MRSSPPSIGDAVHKEFPEVAAKTGLQDATNNGKLFIKAGDKSFEETHVLQADSNFFRVFPTRIAGRRPTDCLAETFYRRPDRSGRQNDISVHPAAAMGKVLETEGNQHFTVTAVCTDLPDNSHMAYDLLDLGGQLSRAGAQLHRDSPTYTYLLLNQDADPGRPRIQIAGDRGEICIGCHQPLFQHVLPAIPGRRETAITIICNRCGVST